MCKLILVAIIVLLIEASTQGAIYSVTDLGVLPGGGSSYATAINDHGAVVGYSDIGGGLDRAFLWTPDGGMQNLGILSEGSSQAFDINNAYHVVGVSGNVYTYFKTFPFRYTQSTGMVQLHDDYTSANDLNEASTAIGTRNSVNGNSSRASLWSASNLLTTPNRITSRGVAINNNGEFVGTTPTSGYFATNSAVITDLGTFLPTDINDARHIAGSLGDLAAIHYIDTSKTTLLGKLSLTDTFSRALGINATGAAVGVSEGTGAFIYEPSTASLGNLSVMLADNYAGWTILIAEDINNIGQIVGVGRFNGVDHAVLLTAIPEPSSITIFALTVSVLWPSRPSHGQRGRAWRS